MEELKEHLTLAFVGLVILFTLISAVGVSASALDKSNLSYTHMGLQGLIFILIFAVVAYGGKEVIFYHSRSHEDLSHVIKRYKKN